MQYKVQSRLEENRKKALDLQLNFIVDQTEKYSSWLAEGLGVQPPSGAASIVSTGPSSPASPRPETGTFNAIFVCTDPGPLCRYLSEGFNLSACC